MKRFIWAALGISIIVGAVFLVNRRTSLTAAESHTTVASETVQAVGEVPAPEAVPVSKVGSGNSQETLAVPSPADGHGAAKPTELEKVLVSHAVDILVSPQATYEQKRAAWKQLRDAGKLDQAIADLEQRVAVDPRSADDAAVLGHAYLQKCGTIQDVREQGILAMQADKVFDTALNLDPSNWEARFTKAVALSYWPATMNKGQEVIDHFQTLIQQQESQAPQPQFAETYLWLGNQYEKTGRTDDAHTVWERGARLFPQNETLKSKLSVTQ